MSYSRPLFLSHRYYVGRQDAAASERLVSRPGSDLKMNVPFTGCGQPIGVGHLDPDPSGFFWWVDNPRNSEPDLLGPASASINSIDAPSPILQWAPELPGGGSVRGDK